MDAVGEWSASSIGVGNAAQIRLLHEMRFPNSVGMLYSAFTHYTGFKVNSGEYKLMGLAPYGSPSYVEHILGEVATLHDDGSLQLDMSYLDYAHSQAMTSELPCTLRGTTASPGGGAHPARDGHRRLGAAGHRDGRAAHGGARPCHHRGATAGNGRRRSAQLRGERAGAAGRPLRRRLDPAAAGDAGGALGAALLQWHHALGRPRRARPSDSQRGSLVGPGYENADIGLYLDSVGAAYDIFADEEELLIQVATLLDDGSTVGWFHGRMEFGPRALGAEHPRRREISARPANGQPQDQVPRVVPSVRALSPA